MNFSNLKSIAQKLQISESTVSRAINNYSDISKSTKKLVRQTVNEMGYKPNVFARRLALGTSETLGFVISNRDNQLKDPFLGEVLSGISSYLNLKGWDLNILSTNNLSDEITLFKNLSISKRVSGLIISRTFYNDERIKILNDLNIPFVVHGRSKNHENYSWLDIDNRTAFIDMTNHLISLGHTKIAHISGASIYNFVKDRALGWKEAMLNNNLSIPDGYFQKAKLSFLGGMKAMNRLLALKYPPTAVCCLSDTIAIGAMQSIRKHKLQPGKDISVIGYDGLEIGAWMQPALSSMKQPLQIVGEKLAEMLVRLVVSKEKPSINQELLKATLVSRETDKPPVR